MPAVRCAVFAVERRPMMMIMMRKYETLYMRCCKYDDMSVR